MPGVVCALLLCGLVASIPTSAGAIGAAAAGDFNGDGYADLVLGVAGEDIGSAVDAGALTVVYGDATGLDTGRSDGLSQSGGIAGSPEAGDQFGRAFATGDFDGDGYDDILVGAPNEAIGDLVAAGGATAIYGSPSGLTSAGSTGLSQSGAINGAPETGDLFGAAIAVADFNGDGRDDAVVGAPGEDEGAIVDSGIVHLIYGSAGGLTTSGDRSYGQSGAVAGAAEAGDHFGTALAVGDFNNDNRPDLAVGVPGEDISGNLEAGAVVILYGNGTGLSTSSTQSFSQSGSVSGTAETGDRFGSALATGDFDGDGYDDLAIGAPGEAVGSASDAGYVHVLYGSGSGLTTAGNWATTQSGISTGADESDDHFGAALAAGDFDGDGRDDLAIGVPGEDLGSVADAGMVNIVYGTASGLGSNDVWSFSQNGSISGAVEAFDLLGSSLVVLDLDGDGYDDLAAGAPGEDVGSASDAGTANVVYGSSNGLRANGNEGVGQSGPVAGTAEDGDGLGLPQYQSWLDRVNLYRRQAGLDPVAEIAELSGGAYLHSRYMVINGVVSHSENPSLPGYTAAGNAAGGQSNVYGTTWAATPDVDAIDGWVTGPFHAIGFLTPALQEVGYGAHRDAGASYIRMAASLDVWGGERDWGASAGGPYAWPGDGAVVPVRRHINEYPSPTTTCPSHQGLPVLAFFETATNVTNATFTHNGQNVQHCVFDGSDYISPDSSAQSLGRSILNSANAVVVMPRYALTPGEDYCYSVTSNGVTVSSCFTVDANA